MDRWYRGSGKRILDLFVSVAATILLMPLLLLIALLVRAKLGAPVIFRRERPGLNGRTFVLFKFRTMEERADSSGRALPDSQRMTALGRLLRAASLDELPELFNVFRGDMSLVGPRPLLKRYLDRYTPEQRRRHEVRPGVTGWAQVNGRNALSWEEKFELDVWYVDHVGLWLDLRILLMTLWSVFTREGISQPGQATAEEFRGRSDC